MIQRTLPHTHRTKEIWQRSVSKTISYGLLILLLDIIFMYMLSDQMKFAFGYLAVSNFYIAAAYFLHERFWDKVTWGKFIYKKGVQGFSSETSKNDLPTFKEIL